MNPLDEWKARDRLSASHLNQVVDVCRTVRSIDGANGIGVWQTNAGTTIFNTGRPPAPRGTFTVYIDEPAPGHEKYYGYYFTDNATEIDPETDLTQVEIGSLGEPILIINPAAPGDGWDLTDGVQNRSLYQARWHAAKATDGRRVAIIDSFDYNTCEEEEPEDPEVAALSSVTSAADTLFYFSDAGVGGITPYTAFGRQLTAAADAAAALLLLGAAPLASPAFIGTPTAPTASAGTNTTQLATTAFVRTEVANLVASAPGALDTLDELAAALGDDASFATTVTTSLAGKAPTSRTISAAGLITGGGDLSADRTFTLTGATIFTDLLTRDGSGSGLDADLLRGTTPGTTGLALLDDATAAAGRTTLGLGTAAVEAATSFLDYGVTVWHSTAQIVAGNALQLDGGIAHVGYCQVYQNTPSASDVFEHRVNLNAGTYAVTFWVIKANNRGILDWTHNGSAWITGQDHYVAGAGTLNQKFTATLTVATAGTQVLRASINGKNALSSNYFILMSVIHFQKTA